MQFGFMTSWPEDARKLVLAVIFFYDIGFPERYTSGIDSEQPYIRC